MVLDFERKTKGPFRGNCHPSVLILTNRYFQITSTELIWRKDKKGHFEADFAPFGFDGWRTRIFDENQCTVSTSEF